jgi:hypothetical protein
MVQASPEARGLIVCTRIVCLFFSRSFSLSLPLPLPFPVPLPLAHTHTHTHTHILPPPTQNERERARHAEKMDMLQYAAEVEARNSQLSSVFGKYATKMVDEYGAAGKNIKPLLKSIAKQSRTTFSQ